MAISTGQGSVSRAESREQSRECLPSAIRRPRRESEPVSGSVTRTSVEQARRFSRSYKCSCYKWINARNKLVNKTPCLISVIYSALRKS